MSSSLLALLWVSLILAIVTAAASALVEIRTKGRASRLLSAGTHPLLMLAMIAGAAAAVWTLAGPGTLVPSAAPSLLSLSISVDRLGGFFLLLICAVSFAIMYDARAWIDAHAGMRRAALLWTLLSTLLAAMLLVVTAGNAFTFLLGWELMSLTSAALILLEGGEARRHAAMVYLIVMHAGAAAVMSAFFLFLPWAPSLSFPAMQAARSSMPAAITAAVMILAIIGFGSKAGIVPLHGVLPGADASAPLPAAALMSAVLVNTAVYGLVRVLFGFTGGGPDWVGLLLLFGGAASALLGALLALAERDVRRMLAYSGIENTGVITMALGAALLFQHEHAMAWAGLALAAALVHTLHHSAAKALVFLGAGDAHHATGSYILDDWGGLMRRLPSTGLAMLIGMAALAGLPLLGGFVGEWLLFRSLIGGSQLASPGLRATLPLLCGVLALAGGLAAAFCTTLLSMAFFGRPRHPAPTTASTPLTSRGVLSLAVVSLALGVFPWLAFKPIFAVMQDLLPGLVIAPFFGTVEHALPWLGLLLLLITVATLLYRRSPVRRMATAWACGAPSLSPRMEYTATSLTKPIRSVFHPVYRPDRTVTVTPALQHAHGHYFPAAISYRSQATLSSERYLFRPVAALVLGWARRFRRLQSGDLQQYLLYLFLTLIALLLGMRWLG